jgi:hypothetical protein
MKHTADFYMTGTKAVALVVAIWALGFPSLLWTLRHFLQ